MDYYILTYSSKPIGESGESCGSVYDLTKACKVCGTGAKLSGNLRIKGISKVKTDIFETLDGDFIISSKLYAIINLLYSDFELLNVVNSKNKKLDYFHLDSRITLPRFNNNSTGFVIENQCHECQRNGYFNDLILGNLERKVPSKVRTLNLYYSKTDFLRFQNDLILRTWECIGLSNIVAQGNLITRYARPWLLIRQDLREILEKSNAKHLDFELIKIK